jgi:hypothetical protein
LKTFAQDNTACTFCTVLSVQYIQQDIYRMIYT